MLQALKVYNYCTEYSVPDVFTWEKAYRGLVFPRSDLKLRVEEEATPSSLLTNPLLLKTSNWERIPEKLAPFSAEQEPILASKSLCMS